jgi:WD40 repeat protein
MEISVSKENPYVGPRSFQQGEQIYGREREAAQLTNLIIAERIVLLYSPSGAGKTSLIQASLIPRLLEMKFRVRPVVRVNLGPASTAGDLHPANNYIFSALLSLEEDTPADQRIPLERLAGMSLREYLSERQSADGRPRVEVLIFDQFEEILSLDPTDQEAKREFFRQVGEALEEASYWALFSMREDLVAALDPYLLLVPSWLSNTFRLDLLGIQAAREAIQAPARRAGVDFEDGAVEKLVDDLRRVRVQRPDGEMEIQLGPYIEPVQLQVVCYRLWDSTRPDEDRIREQDLAAFGEVDQSLSEYYAQRVSAAARETSASERGLREWFDQKLITEQGIRGTVLMGSERKDGLDPRAIRMMVDSHLVRAEKRAGATWFELAHDRLIGPVRSDNAAWFRDHLSPLQKQASVWEQQGRPERLLLHGGDLLEAERWSSEHQDELLSAEREFLEACRVVYERERRARRLSRTITILGIVLVFLVGLNAFYIQASSTAMNMAQLQARQARSGLLAFQALDSLETFPQRGLLLAIEANTILEQGDPTVQAAVESLRAALRDPHGRQLGSHENDVENLAFSPDGRWLATASNDRQGAVVRLWDMESGDPGAGAVLLQDLGDSLTTLAFSPDGRWLATASEQAIEVSISLWDLEVGERPEEVYRLPGHHAPVNQLSFSPDGRWLASGGIDTNILVWDLEAGEWDKNPSQVTQGSSVQALDFSADSAWLATGGLDGSLLLWELETGGQMQPLTLQEHARQVSSLAFSPNGRWLASASADSSAFLWDMQAGDLNGSRITLDQHQGEVTSLAFSHDGRWLVTGGADRTARIWDLEQGDSPAEGPVLGGHEGAITSLAFSPDGRWLATASRDYSLRLWQADFDGEIGEPVVLRGHDGEVVSLAFSPDGRWLASGAFDNSARLWDLEGIGLYGNPYVLHGHFDEVTALAFSPDGGWLATGSKDATSRLWSMAGTSIQEVDTFDQHEREISALAFSPDGRWLATGSLDGTALLWELVGGDPAGVPVILDDHRAWVNSLAFSPDGRWLATGSGDGTARLWDMQAADPAAHSIELLGHLDEVTSLVFSPDGRWLATGGADRTIRLWDLGAADIPEGSVTLAGHQLAITDLAFSPGGRWLASASLESTARLWDLQAGDPGDNPVLLTDHSLRVTALAFSPDGRWLATGSGDRTARLWDLESASTSASSFLLRGHNATVSVLAFSPDDRWLATGGEDRKIFLWDTQAENPAANWQALGEHEGEITSLAFHPDGRWLASGSHDGTARLWLVRLAELIDLACDSAGRNFNQQEWDDYFSGESYRKTCHQWPEGR